MRVQRIQTGETNCYLLGDGDGVVLIDPGPQRGAARVIARVQAAGVEPSDVKLIFVSHGHMDHYGAVAQVRAWCGAPVAAHPSEPAFSRDWRNALPPAQTLRGSLLRWSYLAFRPIVHFAPLKADILLDDGADLAPYGLEAEVVRVAGHSPGSLAVFTAGGDAFVGDLFVNYTLPSQPLYLSDRAAWQQSCERVRKLAPRIVYVGHGEPFSGDKLDSIYPARYQWRWWVR